MSRHYPRGALLFAVAVTLGGCGPRSREMRATPPPLPAAPPVVLVAVAMPGPAFGHVIARLEGSTETAVSSPASGFLIRQVYRDGAAVRKGDLLFVIDARPMSADEDTVKRATGHVQVASPCDGVAARAIPGAGDAVAAGATLTTIATVDPIATEFAIPSTFYRAHSAALERELAFPAAQRPGEVELMTSSGEAYPPRGRLDRATKLGPAGDPVVLRALFPNPDHTLQPGDYVTIHSLSSAAETAVMVPMEAISFDSKSGYTAKVEVVKEDNTIEVRNVVPGGSWNSFGLIVSGLSVGERVVVGGGGASGTKIIPQAYVAPSDSSMPPKSAPGT